MGGSDMKKLLALVLAVLMVLTAMSALAEKNIPELTKEPLEILLWDIATEGVDHVLCKLELLLGSASDDIRQKAGVSI